MAVDHRRADAFGSSRDALNRVSLHAEALPPEGLLHEPFRWRDVFHEELPHADDLHPAAFCLAGPEVEAGASLVEHAVLARLGAGGRVELEHRVGVVDRVLGTAIERHRATMRDMVARAEDAPRAAQAAVRGAHRVTRHALAIPDRVRQAARRTFAALASSRRSIVLGGLVDPRPLSGRDKASAFFVVAATLLAFGLVLHAAVTLAYPDFARPWRAGVALFGYALVNSLGIPFLPLEPAILAGVVVLGSLPTVIVALSAKILAAWLALFVGDAVHDKGLHRLEKREWGRKLVAASERFAARFGLVAVALFIAIPGFPDFVAIYVFASLGMPLWRYLAGVAIGGAALYTVLAFGSEALLRFHI